MILNRILLRGTDKKDSDLIFRTGVNLITGGSDTGKTYVFDLINYVLGSSTPPSQINESKGYNLAFLELSINGIIQTLIRPLDEPDEIKVCYCDIDSINENTVFITYKVSTQAKNSLSKYLMELLGYKEKIFLKSTVKNKEKQLTFRLLLKNFVISEEKITAKSESIVETESSYPHMVFTREKLKFLLTGLGNRKKSIKSKSVIGRATDKLELLQELLIEAEQKLSGVKQNLEENKAYELSKEQIEKFSNEIIEIENEISIHKDRLNENKEKLINLQSELVKAEQTVNRFGMLKKQYETEMERLDFVYEGENYLAQIEKAICPLCHSEIKKEQTSLENIYNAFNSEKRKIAEKRMGIEDAISDVNDRWQEIIFEMERINNHSRKIEDYYINELIPKLDNKKIDYNQVLTYSKLKTKVEIYENEIVELSKKISKYEKMTDDTTSQDDEVNLDDTDYSNRLEELCKNMKDLLEKFKFSDTIEVRFDSKELDFYINSQKRKAYGQGFSALAYISYVMSLKWIADKYKVPTPNFIIFDSPFTSLTEGDEKKGKKILKSNKMIDAFFEYAIKEYANKQLILIENTDDKYDKVDPRVNYCHFSKNKNFGRYGFINKS
ncbi:hypothetical protein CTER_2883 [Ruminiclostridium cellobioparum subsp. termitidis CT1112]|uniref:Rad50/SbcC-type AAA domain-containing protein n=2 Tax=Ruminiclostridium cellobioparum TaxID=29355 RepID=S0FI58_RUMCE|nr:hypothetical protein CTER_2883 [Ruminiclostridium cellobioparum subsp. termitidis CT1112]